MVPLHGAFMAISGDWNDWINELAKPRKVIAVMFGQVPDKTDLLHFR